MMVDGLKPKGVPSQHLDWKPLPDHLMMVDGLKPPDRYFHEGLHYGNFQTI